jgi:hypothetical protein
VGEPFTTLLFGDPGDVMLERRSRSAIGPFHPGNFARHLDDGNLAQVTDAFDGARVGRGGYHGGVFTREEFLDFGCSLSSFGG